MRGSRGDGRRDGRWGKDGRWGGVEGGKLWRISSTGQRGNKLIMIWFCVFCRFYSDSFYPVDYLGWLDEGERDCDGVPSNLAFTSAVRTGFVYQGNESISISGGEFMWLYLNRKVVLQVFNDEADNTKLCKRLNISQASEAGLYNILLITQHHLSATIITSWISKIISSQTN